jgi:hypothetical protein
MIGEIVELSIRYGIITPYTSFLVEEPEQALSEEGRRDISNQAYAAAATATPAPASGAAAVEKSQAQGALEAAQAPAAPGEAYAQQVQVVGDRAFVLRNDVWTDTTFDPTRMSTTKLPFGSDAFFKLLADHPEAGRYFAIGERVIVMIDGTAYETVTSGESVPVSEATPSDLPTSSAPPDNAGEVYTVLSADVVEGIAPLTVNFAGQLVGGPDNNRDYYCVESAFDFGDGNVQSAVPSCAEWTSEAVVQRKYTASYVYDRPGTYRVTFSLAQAHSEALTIVVRDKAGSSKNEKPVPTKTGNTAEGKSGGLCLGPLGLMLLPLLGLTLAGRRR